MVSGQTNANEVIIQTVVEATKAAIQALALAGPEGTQNARPRLGGPMMNSPY